MDNDYHNRIIEAFCKNIDYFENFLGFNVSNIKKNIYLPYGEIDIVLEGKINAALVEVKSNSCCTDKFLKKQFHYYRRYIPSADIYLLTGNIDQSLKIEDFFLKRFWPI